MTAAKLHEVVLFPETPEQRRDRIEKRWAECLSAKGGYWFDIRLGGGPETFTAWAVERAGFMPFAQATGGTPSEAITNLVERTDIDGAFDAMLREVAS